MSSFFGFNVARSGLFASQRALDVTSHNISNANTEGYSRQRLDIVQSFPLSLPGGKGMLGSGVNTEAIRQIRDEFLDFKIRQEFTSSGEWQARSETLQQVEAIFNEPSDSGIRKVMDEFFSALSKLSEGQNSDNLTVRTEVRQRAVALTKTLNHMYSQFEDLQANTDFAIKTTTDQINGYGKQIADLNKQIYKYELDGSNANDLRDQRNLIIDKLSELVNIEVKELKDSEGEGSNKLRIMINGNILVSHDRYNQLITKQRELGNENNYLDVPKLLEVSWDNGSMFDCKSGKLKGLFDMRDQMEGNEKGIPYYMDRLNRFTTVFSARFNMQHGQGFGLSGAGNHNQFFNEPNLDYDPVTGDPTFGYKDVTTPVSAISGSDEDKIKNYEASNPGMTIFKVIDNSTATPTTKWFEAEIVKARDINISQDIEDLNKIAASSGYDSDGDGTLDSGLPGDGSNAGKLKDLRQDTNMFTWGKPDDFFKSIISNLGVDGQEAARMTENQKVLINQIETQRMSISGVSMDEEMANMIKFQHSYNANARVITTIDEMLDKIINGMGIVGR